MLVVPDASVILKWVLPPEREEYVPQARSLRDAYLNGDVDICVPALWLFEVGNILSIKFSHQAEDQMLELCNLNLSVVDSNSHWCRTALDLVHEFGVTFYDAAYHATALVSGGLLVSTDAPYLRKARMAGGTQHLRNWP